MRKGELSAHSNDVDPETAQQIYEEWAAGESGHGQTLTASIGDILKAKAERYDRAAKDPAEVLAETGVMPRGATERKAAKVTEASTEASQTRGNAIADHEKGEKAPHQEVSQEVGELAVEVAELLSDEPDFSKWDDKKSRKFIKRVQSTQKRRLAQAKKKAKPTIQRKQDAAWKMAREYYGLDDDVELKDLPLSQQAKVRWAADKLSREYDFTKPATKSSNQHDGGTKSAKKESGHEQSKDKKVVTDTVDEQKLRDQEWVNGMMDKLTPADRQEVEKRAYRNACIAYRKHLDGQGVKWADHVNSDELREYYEIARMDEVEKRIAEREAGHDMWYLALRDAGIKFDPRDNLETIKSGLTGEQLELVASKFKDRRYRAIHRGELSDKDLSSKERRTEAITRREAGPTPPVEPTEVEVHQLGGGDQDPAPEPEPLPSQPDLMLGYNPLVAVSIDREQMADDRSWEEARDRLKKELDMASPVDKDGNRVKVGLGARVKNAFTRMWKGNIFRGYYERKYQREAREKYTGIESLKLTNDDGTPMTSEQLNERAKSDARYALILRMGQDNDGYVSEMAGEWREKLDEQSEEYQMMTAALRDYVTKDENGKYKIETVEAFNEEMDRIRASLYGIDAEKPDWQEEWQAIKANVASLDNYQAIAMYVRAQVEHGESIDNVLKNFRMYDAESREGARTELYRTKMEAAIDRFQHSKIGQFIPPEWAATAAGALSWAGGAIVRSKLVQWGSFGLSAVAAGGLAGVKRSNQMKVDRTLASRDRAMGRMQGRGAELESESALQGTTYQMESSSDLISSIDQARQSGDIQQIKKAIDEVILRQVISDSRGIDLISYSNPESVEHERTQLLARELELEAAYIAAVRETNPDFDFSDYRSQVLNAVNQIWETGNPADMNSVGDEVPAERLMEIRDDILARDRAFNGMRRRQAFTTGLRTAATSVAFSAAFQEVVAFFNDNIQGVGEALMGRNADAGSKTAVLGLYDRITDLFGVNQTAGATAAEAIAGTTRRVNAGHVDDELLKQWQDQGYDVHENYGIVDVTETKTVSATEAVQGNAHIHRAGWFDNGTGISDRGELALHNSGGNYTYDILHDYTSSNGISVSNQQMLQSAQNGNLRLMVSPTRGTQMNPFEVTGHLEGSRVVFDVEPNSPVAQMLNSGSFHTAEVFDVSNNMVLATDVGTGTADSLTTTVTRGVEQVVSYDVTTPGIAAPDTGVPTADIEAPMPFIFPLARYKSERPSSYEQPRTRQTPVETSTANANNTQSNRNEQEQRELMAQAVDSRMRQLSARFGLKEVSHVLHNYGVGNMFDIANGNLVLNQQGRELIYQQNGLIDDFPSRIEQQLSKPKIRDINNNDLKHATALLYGWVSLLHDAKRQGLIDAIGDDMNRKIADGAIKQALDSNPYSDGLEMLIRDGQHGVTSQAMRQYVEDNMAKLSPQAGFNGMLDNYTEYCQQIEGELVRAFNDQVWNGQISTADLGEAAESFDLPDSGDKTFSALGRKNLGIFIKQHYVQISRSKPTASELLSHFLWLYSDGKVGVDWPDNQR